MLFKKPLIKLIFSLLFYVAATLLAHAETFKSQDYDLNAETLLPGLDHPWGMSFLPDGRLLITERPGKLLLIDLIMNTSIEVTGLPEIHEHGQGGLLDVIAHPDFTQNHLIYLSFANNQGEQYGTEVLRATLTNDNTLTNITTIFKALPKVSGSRHFGSRLVITNDKYLYISLGDRGQKTTAQQLDSHLGSLIRLHDDGSVPKDNPFIGDPNALSEIYSYGHRNIQGMTIRQSDQSLWLHEHGPQGGDEINQPQGGRNYGWPIITFGVNYGIGTKIGEGTHKQGLEQPIYYWDPSIAPSGMAFYQGVPFAKWKDNLFVGSLKFQLLVRLTIEDDKVINEEHLIQREFGRIRDVDVGPEGFIYLLTDSGNGKLIRLSPQ